MCCNEFAKLIHTKMVYISLLVGLVSCLCGLYSYYDTAYFAYAANRPEGISAYNAWLDCLSVGTSFYRIMQPLIIVPFIGSYFIERKSGYTNMLLTRTSRKKYFFSKWFAGVVSAVLITFLVLFLTFLICCVLFPLNQPLPQSTHLHKNFGLAYFLDHPIRCIFLMIAGNMFFSAVYYTIGFSFSNIVSNLYVLHIVPFLMYMLQLILSQMFNISWLSPFIFPAYYEVVGLTPTQMIVVGVFYIIIACLFLLFCYRKDKDLAN